MPLLACANLKYTIGTRLLLDGVALSIEDGERVGMVGRNGCGKTTLMRILTGRVKADSGSINIQRGARIGYLTQDPELNLDNTLRDEAASGFVELLRLHKELDELFHEMAQPENAPAELMDRLMNRQNDLQHRIDAAGGFAVDHKVDQILHGLGFVDAQFDIKVRNLSGGQKGRLALAKLLLESPELLLLDEPTNHLDIAGCEWLEDFLNNDFKGAVLMISHDRRMLDNVVHRIEEVEQGRLIEYPGNYTAFTDIRKQRLLTQNRAYENQQSQWSKEEEYIRRFKAGQRAEEAQGRLSKLERQKDLFALERPVEMGVMGFRLPAAPRSGDQVVVVREAVAEIPDNPRIDLIGAPPSADPPVPDKSSKKILFNDLTVTISRGERWAVIGPNGAGKTSLVRAMLGEMPLTSGTTKLGASVSIGYYQQLPPTTDGDLKVFEYLQFIIRKENPGQLLSEQQARDLAGAFLFSGQSQDKQISSLSGGERSRARLAGLLASAKNLIILDEPTNHLDIPSAERLEQALRNGEEGGGFTGTLLLISHDRALIDAVCDHLIILDGEGNQTVFNGTYSEYQRKLAEIKKAGDAQAAKDKKQQSQPQKSAPPPPSPKPQHKSAHAPAKAATNGAANHPKPAPKKSAGKSEFSWMPADRLEAEIEKTTKKVKAADDDLALEEVYRDRDRFNKTLAARDTAAGELAKMEEEWLRRAE